MSQSFMNYHHLFYFKTIAEEGSVSRAALKLRLGQPTLSAQLKQLEQNLGISLFNRVNRRLILTEHGNVALEYAKNIFKLGNELVEVLNDRLKPLRPSIHIGAIDSIPKRVAVSISHWALRNAPCQITLSEGRFDELLRELSSHRIDIVITDFLPVNTDAKGLVAKSISKKSIALFGAPAFSKLKRGFPKSISGQSVILPTYDSKLRYDIDHWVKLSGIELNVIIESQDIAVKTLCATSGLGLIPTAAHAIADEIKKGSLVEIGKLTAIQEELFILSASRKSPNPVAMRLLNDFSLQG